MKRLQRKDQKKSCEKIRYIINHEIKAHKRFANTLSGTNCCQPRRRRASNRNDMQH